VPVSLSVGYIRATGGAVASAEKASEKSENKIILTIAPRQEQNALIFRKVAFSAFPYDSARPLQKISARPAFLDNGPTQPGTADEQLHFLHREGRTHRADAIDTVDPRGCQKGDAQMGQD
jgi:hypothetical protein